MKLIRKKFFLNFHNLIIPEEIKSNKRKTNLFLSSFYLIFFSTFLTIFSQLPIFTAREITHIFQFGWVIVFIPLLMLDYKRVIKFFLISFSLLLPFLIYCLISLIFNVNSISYGGTLHLLMCAYLLIIFGTFSKYKNYNSFKAICVSYLFSSIIYATFVFFTKLRGYDLGNQIYAFGDKNSAGPIFMFSCVLSFFIFNKKTFINYFIKWSLFVFFTIIIALSKTRTILVIIPIVFFILLFEDSKNQYISFCLLTLFVTLLILVFAVPYLRETIIVKILFNSKTDVNSITSGRIYQIVKNFENFSPILGNGKSYFDSMYLSFLCTYGIAGFLTLVPFLTLPFFVLLKLINLLKNPMLKKVFICFLIIIISSALFEGFGYIGTGAKVFVIWFFIGSFFDEALKNSKISAINKISAKRKMPKFKFSTKKMLLFSIQTMLIIAPIITISITPVTSNIGATVLDKLPQSTKAAEYNEVKDIQINPPVSSMCVGQKITFNIKSDPVDAEDTSVYWSTGWISNPCIEVDAYTGEVTAKKYGNALLHINRYRIGPNGVYIQYPVVEQKNYIFDKTYISTKIFTKSFEHTENETIVLPNNCTSKIFYDSFYVPNENLITLMSSNTNVAIIENGLIKAVSPGECNIYASIQGKEKTQSVNYIKVIVKNHKFVPVNSINFEFPNNCFQNEPYFISPSFNDGASDTAFTIKVDGVSSHIKNNHITFLEPGQATVTIVSDSNNLIKKTYPVIIKENLPIDFECETSRIKIGETKTFSELGIYITFANGYRKIVDDKDIEFDPKNFENRAWSDQNGFVRNRTTIKAVKPGNIKFSLTSKLNNQIHKDFLIISSAYTIEEYSNLTYGFGVIIITLASSITLLFPFFVDIKYRFILYLLQSGFVAFYIIILFNLYRLNTLTIVCSFGLLLLLIATILLQIIKKNKFPLCFFEEPIESTNNKKEFVIYLSKKDFTSIDI